jgi:hypothetical protein
LLLRDDDRRPRGAARRLHCSPECRNWRSRARRSFGRLCRNDEYTASVLVTRDVGCRPYRIKDFQIAMRDEPEGLPILLGLRHISNRSRIYRNGNWKMATGDGAAKPPVQSRKSGICRPRTRAHQHRQGRSPRSGNRQRAGGNVGSSRTAGNRIGDTALAGWGGRIRTLGSREAASRLNSITPNKEPAFFNAIGAAALARANA